MHGSKLPFVPRIEFIRSKLSNLSAHVSGDIDTPGRDHHQTAGEKASTNNRNSRLKTTMPREMMGKPVKNGESSCRGNVPAMQVTMTVEARMY